MMLKIAQNIVYCGIRTGEKPANTLSLIVSVNVISISLVIALTPFCIGNIIRGNTRGALIEGLIILIMAAAIAMLRITKSSLVAALAGRSFLALIIAILCHTFIFGITVERGLFWFVLFPVFAYYIDGPLRGTLWSGAFIGTALLFSALSVLGYVPGPYARNTPMLGAFLSLLTTIAGFMLLYSLRQHRHERTIMAQAFTDTLTDLPNRAKLVIDISAAPRSILILANIDDFKEVSFFGNDVGDFILRELGKKLAHLIGNDPIRLYHLHADEFGLLADAELTLAQVDERVSLYHKVIENTFFRFNDQSLNIGITFGIAEGRENLIEKAAMALTSAKRLKRSHLMFSDSDNLAAAYRTNMEWMKRFKDAMVEHRVMPYFQPIVNNRSGIPEIYECLVRIDDGDGTVASPGEFLEAARRAKLYGFLTRTMIRRSFDFFKDRTESFTINFSYADIEDVTTMAFLKTNIRNYGIGPRFIIEMTESERFEDFNRVLAFVKDMKDLGCRLAIDDFGAGYSNYEYIIRLNADYVKINGALIADIDHDIGAYTLVKTIGKFSEQLDIRSIAEYVESQSIYEIVRALKIDYSQGYYFGKPAPVIETGAGTALPDA
ncbi:MAG: bifunctional diguanylate cyclase/phosphodiesterase [Spirochaetota bacterium]